MDRLVEIAFQLDDPDSSGVMCLRAGDEVVRIQVVGGCLRDSFLEGSGQTFTDYLLEAGIVSAEDYDRSLRIAKEQDLSIFQALMRTGAVSDEQIQDARLELAGRRFARALEQGLDSVVLEPLDGVSEPVGDEEKPISTVLLGVIHSQVKEGRLSEINVPPLAVIRPTERLGRCIGVLRELIGSLPLPRVGGETYEALIARHGASASVAISVMLRAGLIKTAFGSAGAAGGERVLRLGALASLLKLEAVSLMSGVKGDDGDRAGVHLDLGDLWLGRFGALEEARRCYEEASGLDGKVATGRFLALEVLGPASTEVEARWPLERLESVGEGKGERASLIRSLAMRHAARGAPDSALQFVQSAFGLEAASESTLSLFVQLFEHNSRLLRDVSGVDAVAFILDAVRCAREIGKPDIASHMLAEGEIAMDGSSDLLEQAMDLYREKGWSPDLIEVVVNFACDANRKGWTNPLWSLGGTITRTEEDLPLRLVIDIYEVLVKASPNRREALDKLVKMVEALGLPNLLLDLLERSLEVMTDGEALEGIYSRLARLYLEQFGDLKEASRHASHCVVKRPEHSESVQLVLKAAKAGKLSRSSGYRFAKSMTRLSAIPTPEKLGWLVSAARIAEKDLKDLPLALDLLQRIMKEYGRDAPGLDVKRDIARLEGTISGLTGERTALAEGLDLDELSGDLERVVEEAEALKRLARISLQFEDGRADACRLLQILLDADVHDWDAMELALIKVDDADLRRDLIGKVAASLKVGTESHPPLPLLEEMAEAWREVGGDDGSHGALLDGVHGAILAVSPFHRESVRHLGQRASAVGDVDRIVQFTERRIATARPQERGNLYVELASYGDLIREYETRAPTFWRIGSNSMPAHPSVLANDFVELYDQGQWLESCVWLETNLPYFPRSTRPRIYAMMRRLADRARDRAGAMDAAVRALRHTPWDRDLALEILGRAGEEDSAEGHAVVLENLIQWHYLDPDMPGKVERAASGLASRAVDGAVLTRSARRLCSLGLPGTPAIVNLLERIAGLCAGLGEADAAALCLERAIVATDDAEKRVDLVLRIADVFESLGEAGVERLLVALLRASRAGAGDDVVLPWVERVLDRAGVDWTSSDALRTVFAESVGPDDLEWIDVLVAMFMKLVLGRGEEGRRLLDEAVEDGGQTVKIAAAALHGLEGSGADSVEALTAAASSAGDPGEAANLWVQASKMREEGGQMEEAADAALEALALCPDSGDVLARTESLALAVKDSRRLMRIYELAQSSLPGKKSEQAFHYRFAKRFEDLFGDRPGAMDMYLMSLSVQPKAGAALEAVERLSHTMQKHDGLVRAAGMLRMADRDRKAISAFIARNAELFLEEENLASAYHLVLDAVTGDPGLDLLAEVRLMADRSQAGRSSASKIVHRWVPALEQAILKRGDDTDLPRRLDAVAELKHLLAEGPARETAAPTRKSRHSIPPEADAVWDALGNEGDEGESEITFEQMPPEVGPQADESEEFGMSPLEEELEDSKVTLMPKPRASQRETVAGPPPDEPRSGEATPAREPDRRVVAPPAVEVERADTSQPPPTRPSREGPRSDGPRPRLGKRRSDRKFNITAPMPVVRMPSKEGGLASAREAAPEPEKAPAQETTRQWSSPIVDAIGQREEVEPEVIVRDAAESRVIMRAGTSPPSGSVLEDLRSARAEEGDAEFEEDDCSVEVLVGTDEDFPVELTEEEAEGERSDEARPYDGAERMFEAGVGGEEPLELFAAEPWDLDLARRILADPAGSRTGVEAMLRSLLSLCDEDPRAYRPRRPAFKDSRSTLDAFKRLLGDAPRYEHLKILGLVWDSAARLFKETIGDYGMRTADQISPFSTGPVAPILEKAIRSLGYVRMAVYYRREKRYELHVVRTTPPSVAVSLPLGRLPLSLEFYLARCFWAVNPRRILACSLGVQDGQRLLQAVQAAFGPARAPGEKVDATVSALTQDLWHLVPEKIQGKLRSLHERVDPMDFATLQRMSKLECTFAGLLFSGDLASAVRHGLPEDLPTSHTGSVEPSVLSEAILRAPHVQDLICFGLSADVLDFFDRVLD
ncbi:MAG: hypothetical protein JRG91_01565 [Deltaproteobacteria bacterium]|nr:hypothetical protein [Deltaproteobacteria bacterium]